MKKKPDINLPLDRISDILNNKNRIGIMTLLMVNEIATFTYLKKHLQLTDGNLNSHLKALEKNEFISFEKKFVDNKPQTTYKITLKGKTSFLDHIHNLEMIIKQIRNK